RSNHRSPITRVLTVTITSAGSLSMTADTLAINIGGLYSITGTTCSFTTLLAPLGTCTITVRYATPVTQPALPDIGAITVSNNGTGTAAGSSVLALVAR